VLVVSDVGGLISARGGREFDPPLQYRRYHPANFYIC
jgi:hypothetical protein